MVALLYDLAVDLERIAAVFQKRCSERQQSSAEVAPVRTPSVGSCRNFCAHAGVAGTEEWFPVGSKDRYTFYAAFFQTPDRLCQIKGNVVEFAEIRTGPCVKDSHFYLRIFMSQYPFSHGADGSVAPCGGNSIIKRGVKSFCSFKGFINGREDDLIELYVFLAEQLPQPGESFYSPAAFGRGIDKKEDLHL